MKKQSMIKNSGYKAEGFIGQYQKLVREVVIPYQYSVLNDELPDVEKSHVIDNFRNAAAAIKGEDVKDGFYGMVFQDSDAGKWIEAAAYSLQNYPDKQLEKTVDEFIDVIACAQEEDGYLNTYFTIKDKEKRWTNLLEAHELYTAGHLIEAACAYYEATGKRKFLDVMLKNVKHIHKHFVTDNNEGFPGHPEIELALLKLYRITDDKDCIELCRKFIDTRGVNTDFYKQEKEKRDWTVWGNNAEDNYYQQSNAPVRNLDKATGHAVRAVYLYTAMADLSGETDDEELFAACERLWQDITERKMYITGAIGSTVHGEAFSTDYDLPSDTAYAETCASIGLMFFAARMLEKDVDSRYSDVMERAFYNTVLAGMQLDGRRFFYVNPLEVVPGISGVIATHWHARPQRPGWYGCACCPPNVARLITSFGKYAYGENENTAFCHLFAGGRVEFSNGMKFTCETRYPYGFAVTYKIEKGGKMAIRIPAWSESYLVLLNKRPVRTEKVKGYIYVDVADGDTLIITLDDSIRTNYASTRVHDLTGKVALSRGPLVYCFEGVDNDNDVLSIALKKRCGAMVTENDDLPCESIAIGVEAVRKTAPDSLYSFEPPTEEEITAIAVPYYIWGNRGENQMRVWMDEA
ncbi:MAG: glycoside hydrolase family 127 protein [Ruminiclostridium sp.]|nr:glycoside hydrolase family 127 protein [Ruminiclostridium sp.]